jgi:hypothetical protein
VCLDRVNRGQKGVISNASEEEGRQEDGQEEVLEEEVAL